MNSEQIFTTALDPFIRKFVFFIIQNIQSKKFSYEEKHIIHADLIPKVSKKIAHATLKEKKIEEHQPFQNIKNRESFTVSSPIIFPHSTKSKYPELQKNIERKIIEGKNIEIPKIQQKFEHIPTIQKIIPLRQINQISTTSQQIQKPIYPTIQIENNLNQNYGKIEPLLYDPSVSSIECQGANKPIMVIQAGQKQITKIFLTKEEINKILNHISDLVHIPILEGVFRVSVGNFSISAIISEIVGTKFIIKKMTPYAMFEH